MKQTILFIVVILIILLGILLIKSSKTEAPTEESSQEKSMEVSSIENGTYSLDQENSQIKWIGKKKILTNWIDEGTIKIQDAKISVENSTFSSDEILIDMNSISANKTGAGEGKGNDSLTKHLKSADFFDVENYPTSKFVVTEIKQTSENNFEVTGNLTIKDKTNEIKTSAKLSMLDGLYKVNGSIDLDRTLWDIKFGSDKFFQGLGDNVIDDIFTIEFDLIFDKNE